MPDAEVPRLRTPDFTDRLLLAADIARMTPSDVRRGLQRIGVTTGEKSIYKFFDGSTQRTTPRMLAGLARVFGTDVRWFCESDDDGSLYRALVARWAHVQRGDAADAQQTGRADQ